MEKTFLPICSQCLTQRPSKYLRKEREKGKKKGGGEEREGGEREGGGMKERRKISSH